MADLRPYGLAVLRPGGLSSLTCVGDPAADHDPETTRWREFVDRLRALMASRWPLAGPETRSQVGQGGSKAQGEIGAHRAEETIEVLP